MLNTKIALFLSITATIFFTSCRVQKNISKQETQKEEANKVDSAATVKNDIQKETKAVTETTEIIDSAAFITPDGKLINDPKDVTKESIKVPIKKKKTTKRTEDIKETDQSKSEVQVNKKEEKKEETSEKVKVIEKTGFTLPWFWWIIIIVLVAGYLAWRYRKFLPFGMFVQK